MKLEDILQDIHTLEDEMRSFERKYGVLSETFYESYMEGEEPEEDAWVRDWTAWASAYSVWQRRREQYLAAIQSLRADTLSLSQVIAKTARHETISIPA